MSRRPLTPTNRQNQDAGSSLPGEPALLVVGHLRHAHGVKGEISMEVLTDFPERLRKGKQVFVGESHAPMIITGTRWKDKVMLLTFEGYTDCDQVNMLRNLQVYIRTENLPSLPEGEYYFHQLVGLKVLDEAGTLLGQLEEVMETGANDVYLVRSPSGDEILLPAIEAVILKVDLEGGEMTVRPPVWS
jgi:16S rRNA processing protein RimM